MRAEVEISKRSEGDYEVTLQGPAFDWRIASRHRYTCVVCKDLSDVLLALQHYYAAPWHDENGYVNCPVCLKIKDGQTGKGEKA